MVAGAHAWGQISGAPCRRGPRCGVRILWSDRRACVVDKPPGLAVHRGWADDDDALLQQVRDALGVLVYPVNRLDRGASGCVLFALDREAAGTLGRAFAGDGDGAAVIDKRYTALTRGHPPAHLVLDYPIPKAPGEARVPAVTELWCRETFGRYAVVEAAPRTGRLHQIRRHLKHLSCPLIGDVNYGKGEHNRLFRAEHGLHRLALHAHRLTFPHPDDGRAITVDAPLAEDLAAAIASARAAYRTSTAVESAP
jgi:tRNA pseudouridine65 synthase